MPYNEFSPLKSLDCFSRIFPIKGAVVIGAGMGQGPWFDLFLQQGIKDVALIDGSAQCAAQLEKIYADQMDWQIYQHVLSDHQGEDCFYHLSSALESGLLSAEELRGLWPNIKLKEEQILEAVTLSDFHETVSFDTNWLIVDCLPAWTVVGGESSALNKYDVIIVRSTTGDSSIDGAGSGLLQSLLRRVGFICVGSETERNPALCHEVYVKDVAQLCASVNEQKKLAADRQVEIEGLQKARDKQSRQAQERQEQIEQLSKQLDEQQKLAADRLVKIEGLQKSWDEQAKLAQERQVEIIALKKTSGEQKLVRHLSNLEARVEACLSAQDIHAAIDHELDAKGLPETEKIDFILKLSDAFFDRGDRLTALHFLRMPLNQELSMDTAQKEKIVSGLIAQGRADLASDVVINDLLVKQTIEGLDTEAQEAIKRAYSDTIKKRNAKAEHGHDLLLAYLEANIAKYKNEHGENKPVLIEIGTTRENVPGQGSTRKIAEFCNENGLQFITVDMDPHNIYMAQKMFSRLGFDAQAITAKGEDFLRDYEGRFDFVFLDAYDFDHGGHSELRQRRYEKFLGERIDDKACHKMHLDCAQSVVAKLSEKGVVCVDDTWLEDDAWTAKGTLAMPYFIEQGFVVLEARNRAALLAKPVQ